jgi:RimJ/RimL family protein N-acetyltransferase
MSNINEQHPTPPIVIDGPRIRLQARSKDHAIEMFTLIQKNREHLRSWMPWEEKTKTVEDSINYLELAMSWWATSTNAFEYSIFDNSTSKMIGSIGIHALNWENRTCASGYWIDKDFEGQGFISEAMKLIEVAALGLGFHRIVITCDRLNQRSQSVPKRLGYKLEATEVDECVVRGHMRDTLQFVKLLNPAIAGHVTENLPLGYSIKECNGEDFSAFTQKHIQNVFDDNCMMVRIPDLVSDIEVSKIKSLNEGLLSPWAYHLVLFHEEKVAGWTWGYKDSRESFYMVNSAILPEHRGRGLYTRLLDETLKKLIEMGFQRIWSRHSMTNNAILVPKLKRGFVITATELNDAFGILIQLTYYTNRTRRKILDFRTGQTRPDQEIKDIFKL